MRNITNNSNSNITHSVVVATARPTAACTGTKQCWERGGKKSCGVLIASYYSAHSAVTHTTATLYTVSPNMALLINSTPTQGASSPQRWLQRLQSLQLALQVVMFIDSGWTARVPGPGHWPPCAVMAVMWCRNAMCCYHLFMGRGDIRGHCYGDQATDHRPPSPSPANILLLLRNQLKPDPIKEVPKYYRALIWVSFSYQSRTT